MNAKLIDLPGLPKNVRNSYKMDLKVIDRLTEKALAMNFAVGGPKIKLIQHEPGDNDSFGNLSEEEETKIDPKLLQTHKALEAGDLELYWSIRNGDNVDYKAMLGSQLPKIGENIFQT